MSSFEEMYFHLFNAITDALREMEAQNYSGAVQTLVAAQQWGESSYLIITDPER